jgi:hypothetical protein
LTLSGREFRKQKQGEADRLRLAAFWSPWTRKGLLESVGAGGVDLPFSKLVAPADRKTNQNQTKKQRSGSFWHLFKLFGS